MSKHTPGPWHHDEYGHICAGPQIIGIAYQFELDDSDYDELPCIPNARLMAAAPELFQILDALLGFDSAASYRGRTTGYQLIKELKKANK
jgi:hypothetical protein